ncbi:MAG: hypothetical protein WDN28_28535 [Chthoniobacter sp.]
MDVDLTGRFYLAILVVFAVAAGIFWSTDRPAQNGEESRNTDGHSAVYMKPRHLTQITPDALVPPFITTEAEAARRRCGCIQTSAWRILR